MKSLANAISIYHGLHTGNRQGSRLLVHSFDLKQEKHDAGKYISMSPDDTPFIGAEKSREAISHFPVVYVEFVSLPDQLGNLKIVDSLCSIILRLLIRRPS